MGYCAWGPSPPSGRIAPSCHSCISILPPTPFTAATQSAQASAVWGLIRVNIGFCVAEVWSTAQDSVITSPTPPRTRRR